MNKTKKCTVLPRRVVNQGNTARAWGKMAHFYKSELKICNKFLNVPEAHVNFHKLNKQSIIIF